MLLGEAWERRAGRQVCSDGPPGEESAWAATPRRPAEASRDPARRGLAGLAREGLPPQGLGRPTALPRRGQPSLQDDALKLPRRALSSDVRLWGSPPRLKEVRGEDGTGRQLGPLGEASPLPSARAAGRRRRQTRGPCSGPPRTPRKSKCVAHLLGTGGFDYVPDV